MSRFLYLHLCDRSSISLTFSASRRRSDMDPPPVYSPLYPRDATTYWTISQAALDDLEGVLGAAVSLASGLHARMISVALLSLFCGMLH